MNYETTLSEISKLTERFTRSIPDTKQYQSRLAEEVDLIVEHRFVKHFVRVWEILRLTEDFPHITRGSAGCSLVCYLMGISDVDPVEEKIPLARFINPKRDDLPDIDLDFPHWAQATVMQRIYDNWPQQSARVSNFVTFKERSALKEACKRLGAKHKDLHRGFKLERVVPGHEQEAERIAKKLLGKKNYISKHCGGVLIFDRKVPKSLINGENQILLDKYEIEDLEHFKIDILANRGLSQLWEINQRTPTEYPEHDDATVRLLQSGDVLGVTQAESPAMRRLFRAIKPTSRSDCTFATALVRPVAMQGRRKASFFQDWSKNKFSDTTVYEDDAIERIARLIGCNHYEADMWRRAFAKRNEEKVMQFYSVLGSHPNKDEIVEDLRQLSGFGICRAHAINLGRLIWALAYEKAHNPEQFWKSAIKHCQGSYRRWVYQRESRISGAVNWGTNLMDELEEFKSKGYWTGPNFIPGMFIARSQGKASFRGIVANSRVFRGERGKYVTFLTLGIGNGEYIDVTLHSAQSTRLSPIVQGHGFLKINNRTEYIDCKSYKTITIDKMDKI
mgnify:CR=1 FL=1